MPSKDGTKYAEIGRRLREIPVDDHISSYEWEELVQRLYNSNDAGLHEIGIKELGQLRRQQTLSKGT